MKTTYEELEAKCAALAAELKSGTGFFMYSEETAFEFHKTKAEAVASAENIGVGAYRHGIAGG